MIRKRKEEKERERERAAKEDSGITSPRAAPAAAAASSSPPAASRGSLPAVHPNGAAAAAPVSPLPLSSYSSDASSTRLSKHRSAGSRTHRRTLARQINFKEVAEENEGGSRPRPAEEERERERERDRAPSAVSSQSRPVIGAGQWRAQQSVLVPDSSSDESEDGEAVAERERRQQQQEREKEKEMRLHGLLPAVKPKKPAPLSPQLPAVAAAPAPPPPHPAAAAESLPAAALDDRDYSGFHKKALKWQKKSRKEKQTTAAAASAQQPAATTARHPPAAALTQAAAAAGAAAAAAAAATPAATTAEQRLTGEKGGKAEVEGEKKQAAAEQKKAGKGARKLKGAESDVLQRPKRVGGWKLAGLTAAQQQQQEAGIAVTALSLHKPKPTEAAAAPEEQPAEREQDQQGEKAETAARETRAEAVSADASAVKLQLSDRAAALLTSSSPLSGSLSSSLTSSLTRALHSSASSGASLIAHADMEMRKQQQQQQQQRAASASHTPAAPSSPQAQHRPILSPHSIAAAAAAFAALQQHHPASSRPTSRKQRRVEAAFSIETQDSEGTEGDELSGAAVVAPAPHSAALAFLSGTAALSVTQPIMLESCEAEGEEAVREETVLSLRTIAMPVVTQPASTATVLSNYLHDLSQAAQHNASAPSLPPPPLSVHSLVHAADEPAASAPPPADYEPSAEAVLSYAVCLGMDLPFDSDLLWIPRLALLHPLPEPWRCCQSEGCIYFVHWESGECSFADPSDEFYYSLYRTEKERKWGLLIEQEMERSGVRQDGRLDMSGQRLDDIGMEVLSDMILGMGEMEDDKDERRRAGRGRGGQQLQAGDSDSELRIAGFNIGILLTSLDLSNNRIGSAGCETLLSSLSLSLHAPLAALNLSSNLLTADCCHSLSRYLQHNPFLLQLDLSHNEAIGNMGAEHLARHLTSASSLRWLGLQRCGLSDFGCQYLCAGLQRHAAIAALDLRDNDIGQRGWRDIGRLLMTCPSLWEMRATGLRQGKGEMMQVVGEQQAADEEEEEREAQQLQPTEGEAAEAQLVRSEVLLCLARNRESVLSKRRLQAALLLGLGARTGEKSALRRVFAVEAWAEKEEERGERPSAASSSPAAGADDRQQRKDGRKEGVQRKPAQRKKREKTDTGALNRRKRGEKRKAKGDGAQSGRQQAAGAAAGLDGSSGSGVLLGDGGVSVRIGSVGIARQQGLANNALRQVWAYL